MPVFFGVLGCPLKRDIEGLGFRVGGLLVVNEAGFHGVFHGGCCRFYRNLNEHVGAYCGWTNSYAPPKNLKRCNSP